MKAYRYVGAELDLFASATNWKAYVLSQVKPYLGEEVLEVGAGLGGTTRALCPEAAKRWVCLEPDAALATQLVALHRNGVLPAICQIITGDLEVLQREHSRLQSFDTILYVDVLEHIEDDIGELQKATRYLKVGGYIVILAPAHQWLYSPFDRSIGHFRRYTKVSLASYTPKSAEIVRLVYLDAIGLLASLGNALVLRRSIPKAVHITSWDKVMVPISRVIDPLLGYSVGKSVLAVWRKIKREP